MQRSIFHSNSDQDRPTFDEMQAEKREIIGPPSPPQIPKFTSASERAAVYRMMLDDLTERIAEESRQAMDDQD